MCVWGSDEKWKEEILKRNAVSLELIFWFFLFNEKKNAAGRHADTTQATGGKMKNRAGRQKTKIELQERILYNK